MEEAVKEEWQARLGKTEPLVVGDKVYIPSFVRDLTVTEVEKARIELGETEEKKRKCLQELKNKLSRKGNYRTDDDFLLRFLRVRKFDCKKAYQNVKNFYDKRNKHFEFFGIPSQIKSYKTFKFINVLPYADEEGRILVWIDTEYWDLDVMSFEEFIQPLFAMSDVIITNPKFQVNGFVYLCNMKGVGLRHLTVLLRKKRLLDIASFQTNSYPWRIKQIIMLNSSAIARYIFTLIRPVMSKKVAQRISLLGSDLSELHELMDPAILPKQLGGMLDDDFCQWPELLLDNISYLEYDRSFTGLS